MNRDEISAADADRSPPALGFTYGDKKTEMEDEYDVKADVKGGYDQDIPLQTLPAGEEATVKQDMQMIEDELEKLEPKLNAMSLERATRITRQLMVMHKHDQNFPQAVLDRMDEFINNPDVLANPQAHGALIREIKLECVLATENSPYVEVRANVDPTDDPTMPALTIRVWIIGVIFSGAGSFIDTLFGYRNPAVYVGSNVGQLVGYPAGKLLEKILPDFRFRLFGQEHSLNPGPFNKKEHMLITIMCSVSFNAPYTNYIIPAQALPVFFNESFAYSRGYQFLNTLGTNFVGYGLAGLTRRFLVYPSVAVWPSAFNTIGLIKAFHTGQNEAVRGPFNMTYTASREKAFLIAFVCMFCYFFFPGYIFGAMSTFSWITWIAPDNATLDTVCGFYGGLGLNPWPTFDWNNLTAWLTPLTIPTFAIMNMFVGILIGAVMRVLFRPESGLPINLRRRSLAVYYTNSWNTSYLRINSNKAWDNTGHHYKVTAILNDKNLLDENLYQAYSEPWMPAGFIMSNVWYFAMYAATCTYVIMFQRHSVVAGAHSLWKSIKKVLRIRSINEEEEDDLSEDVHYRLMKQNYKEIHEWVYLVVLLISMVFGMVGVGIYPTNTSPVVLVFGIIMPLIVMIPCGLIQAVTGIAVPLNVLAEFIGGALTEGNANGLMYFKTYGYIAVYQALLFSNDLKLAHYLKCPPRHTFAVQMVGTLIYCLVSAAIFNFAMSFRDICTADAAFRFTCPNQTTFYTAAVFWGTISPKRLFGPGKRYNLMLLGFPLGVILVFIYWGLRRRYPRSEFIRQIHPVMICAGPSTWGTPYNMSYYIGNVYVTWLSFQYVRKRYLGFWAKYNYVIAAAFPAGIAISTIVIFFALEIPKGGTLGITWWGNTVVAEGCEATGGCPRFSTLPDIGYFGADPGHYS